MFSDVSLILWISVFLQCIAVILALRLIPVTSHSLAWLLLSATFFLMATRRAISLLGREGLITSDWLIALTTESVALVISSLLVVAIFLIGKIFSRINEDQVQIRKLSQAMEQSANGTLVLDTEGKIEYANPAFCQLYGLEAENITGKLPDILKPEKNKKNTLKELWNTLNAGGTWESEFHRDERGVNRWEKVCISPVKDELDQQTIHFIATFENITTQKNQLAKMEYMATHDNLTNLPNRAMVTNILAQKVIRAGGRRESIAIILMDANNFKEVNDQLGHSTGDEILKEIAGRLHNCVDDNTTVARIGGDEFLIVIPSCTYEQCLNVVSKITTAAKTPFVFENKNIEIVFSLGISMYPEDSEDHNVLLRQAETAMYLAKDSALKFLRFKPEFKNGQVSTPELTSEIRKAVENNELELVYQPKIDFSSGHVNGVEALIRWQHPVRGTLLPDTFIPLAEKSGHILLITEWVVKEGLRMLSRCHKSGHHISTSINISARDLLNPKLPKILKNEITTNQIDPSCLTLEITESTIMMYSQQTMDTLNTLIETGVRFSLDDFGTGYSSLQHLKELPLSELKIDKSFICNMTESDDDAIIVRSMIDLAHNLGLTVTAEGIEEKDVYDILRILGCDAGQGYLFKKPMTEEDLCKYL